MPDRLMSRVPDGSVTAVSRSRAISPSAPRAAIRDAVERQRAQEELALARDEALEASRMKSVFVANVSHEIRTPMNGVIGMAALLLDTALDHDQREYAETISSSGEALLEIIDDILDLSKIEAGKLALDPTDIDPRDAIERACGMLALRAHGKALGFIVVIDPDMPRLVHVDGARLRQVIASLVSNAIEFTGAGEVVVRATTTGPTDGRLPLLRIEVSDEGIGIDRIALDNLFKPFSRHAGSCCSQADHRLDPPSAAVLDGMLTKPVRQSRPHEALRAIIAGNHEDPRQLADAGQPAGAP